MSEEEGAHKDCAAACGVGLCLGAWRGRCKAVLSTRLYDRNGKKKRNGKRRASCLWELQGAEKVPPRRRRAGKVRLPLYGRVIKVADAEIYS